MELLYFAIRVPPPFSTIICIVIFLQSPGSCKSWQINNECHLQKDTVLQGKLFKELSMMSEVVPVLLWLIKLGLVPVVLRIDGLQGY